MPAPTAAGADAARTDVADIDLARFGGDDSGSADSQGSDGAAIPDFFCIRVDTRASPLPRLPGASVAARNDSLRVSRLRSSDGSARTQASPVDDVGEAGGSGGELPGAPPPLAAEAGARAVASPLAVVDDARGVQRSKSASSSSRLVKVGRAAAAAVSRVMLGAGRSPTAGAASRAAAGAPPLVGAKTPSPVLAARAPAPAAAALLPAAVAAAAAAHANAPAQSELPPPSPAVSGGMGGGATAFASSAGALPQAIPASPEPPAAAAAREAAGIDRAARAQGPTLPSHTHSRRQSWDAATSSVGSRAGKGYTVALAPQGGAVQGGSPASTSRPPRASAAAPPTASPAHAA